MRGDATAFRLSLTLSVLCAIAARAETFQLHGVAVELQEVSEDVDVYYRSMRFNRAAGVWNVEVLLSNKSSQVFSGPLVYVVAGFTNTTGPLQPDGRNGAQVFFDLSPTVADGALDPGELSRPFTLSLGVSSGAPQLSARVYARRPASGLALAVTRTLNEAGQPLPTAVIAESGPTGQTSRASEPVFGFATLGQAAGPHVWRFSAPDYLPVWRLQTLAIGVVEIVAPPRLTRRHPGRVALTALAGGELRTADETVRVRFGAGTVLGGTVATLTPLSGQTLPALLPAGWSPLSAFWLEVAPEPLSPATVEFTLPGALRPGDVVTLARWHEAALQWTVLQILAGAGNSITSTVPQVGAYALVLGDAAPTAPPIPQPGQPLLPAVVSMPSPTNLLATGTVTPGTVPASRVAELVTARAEVVLTNRAGPLPSGVLLHCELADSYQLNDGSRRFPPRYENFILGYQRPGDTDPATLHAQFPLRPLLLFGPEELTEATVHVDVLAPGAFSGGVFGSDGGQIARDGLRILAGVGDFAKPHAAQLRRLNPTNFLELVDTNFTVLEAFELAVDGLDAGRNLRVQLSGAPTNALFVLGRVRVENGLYGIEPRERLVSDARGNLATLEPATGDRLPGLTTAGQYVLLQARQPQALITGVARNAAGQPADGLVLRSFPWLTFSATNGAYQLLAPTGTVNVTVFDPATGDVGNASAAVSDALSTVTVDLNNLAVGLRVVSVSPTNGATRVLRGTPVVVQFNRPLNPVAAQQGVQLLGSNGVPVPASLSLNLEGTRLTLLPLNPLSPDTLHTLRLATSLTDRIGRPLEGPSTFTFTSASDALTRPAGAQLIVYEPGATNCPCAQGTPGYVAGDRSLVCVEGTQGIAEPEVAVVLVNETTGETATVLSQPDGSFKSFIRAGEEDRIAATFLNANGTRISVAADQQRFDNGMVGLFAQGGVVSAEGEGGTFQLIIPPGTIRNKAVLRLEPMSLQETLNSLTNPPTDAEVIAGLKISIKDLDLAGPTDISIPIDPARIRLPDGLPPEEGAYALALVRELESGGVAYQIVDKLAYRGGRLRSNTAPFKGMGEALTDAIAENPIGVLGLVLNPVEAIVSATVTVLLLGNRPVTVTGRVGLCPAPPDQSCVDEQLDSFFQGLSLLPGAVGQAFEAAAGLAETLGQMTRRPLPGAFMSLSLPQTNSGRAGRLQPGIAYATSDQRGIYALVLPFANGGYVLNATHPRFSEQNSVPLRPFVDYELGQGAIRRNFSFQVPIPAQAAPRVDVSHSPLFPPTNQPASLVVDVIHPAATTVQVSVDGVEPAGAGNSTSDVTILGQVDSNPGPSQKRKVVTLACAKALTARLKISVTTTGAEGGSVVRYHRIPFGLVPAPTANQAIQSDPEDKTGPQLERTEPLEGGGLKPGAPVVLIFNEPIDAAVRQQASQFTLNDPLAGPPTLVLSPDQTRLELHFASVRPGKEYELTVSAPIQDLAGNALVLPPPMTGSFKLKFRTLPVQTTPLTGVSQGGGVAMHGNFAYVLDRAGDGRLLVYDLSNPAQPTLVSSTIQFIGPPRDLVVLPAWPHVRQLGGPVQTNDLLAVVGGHLGTSSLSTEENVFFHGQYLRVFDISNPANPVRILGATLTLRPNAVTKIRWEPPFLAFLEVGSDLQQVGLIDLQEMLVGFNATPEQIAGFPLFGIRGIDANGDGDYVDAAEGDRVPTPRRTPNEFFGRGRSFLPDLNFGRRLWLDFDYKVRGNYCGVVFKEGDELNQLGSPTGIKLPPGYRTLALGEDVDSPSATVSFGFGAVPKRVFGMLRVDVSTNDTPDFRHLALVSLSPDSDGQSKLAVIDISQPAAPVLVNRIVLPPQLNLGLAQSVRRRPGRQLALATTTDLLLLDERKLLIPGPPGGTHPAILGIVPGAGSGNISLGGNAVGVNVVALGGRNQLVQEPPRLQFVRILRGALTDPAQLAGNPTLRQEVFEAMHATDVVGPARYRTNNGAANPTLNPPNPTNHYHVLMHVPGGAGDKIKLGLQALNRAGHPLKNKGRGFAPVRAVSSFAAQQIKQEARPGCDAVSGALTAYRLSSDKSDPFYNVYLSKPFALTYERMSPEEVDPLRANPEREILWSDFYLEAFIDPAEFANPVVGPFAAAVGSPNSGQDLILLPRAGVVAETFPGTYIPGPNPPPTSEAEKMPGTFGLISAHNGEFRHETVDLALPGRRMPIVFERVLGGQDLYEGPFGRGWDSTYHQRLTPLRPNIVGVGHRLPLILRALNAQSTVAEPGDVLWHTGRGRLVLYKNKGSQAPPEVAADPLLDELGWRERIRAYYLPASPEAGIFDPLFEFYDGQFARLTPDGRQYWFNRSGRLEKIYHRYTKNHHKLVYNQRGELVKIVDASIANEQRFLEVGYYRFPGDAQFVSGLDVVTSKVFIAGKIARLRDYTGRVIDFEYTDDGILQKRLGIEGSSANNGEGGRVETVYLYTDPCSGFLQGVATGGSSATAPLFAASVNPVSGQVTGSGNGVGGAVTLSAPAQNDAASVGGSSAAVTGPDGAQTKTTFDENGFPARVEHSGPNAPDAAVEMRHGAYGLLEKIVYPLGNAVEFRYDTNNPLLRMRGNLLEEKRLPGSRPGSVLTRTFSGYNPRYNLPVGAATDFNGKSLTYTLTSDGRDIEKIAYANAGALTYAYNEFGQIERITTPEGIVMDPTYNSDGFKESEQRGATTFGYTYGTGRAGRLGVPNQIVLPAGDPITDIQYDDRLLLLGFTRGAYSEKRGYDRNGNPKYIERDLGGGRKRIERRTYNPVNFLEKVEVENVEVNGSGTTLTTRFVSSAADVWRIKEIQYPGGQKRQFTYNHLGHMVRMQLGGYHEEYARDLHGNLLGLKRGGQETRVYDYDGHDRVIKITDKLGAGGDDVTEFDYFGNGELKRLTVTSAGFGVVREIAVSDVDGLGRPTERIIRADSGDAVFKFNYTASAGGQIVSEGPRATTTFQYDAAGRTTGWSDFLATVTATPDGNGNLLNLVSAESGGTYGASFTYDGLDHLTSVSDSVGELIRVTPLADGSPQTVKDGRGNAIENTLSVYGEITSSTRPSGVQFVYHYDANRLPTLTGDGTGAGHHRETDTATFRQTSRKLRSGAAFTYGGFNALNLPEQIITPVGMSTLEYDLQGRVTRQVSTHEQGENYEVTMKWDALGRVRESGYGRSAAEHKAILTYDKLGPLRSATYDEALGVFTVAVGLYTDGTRQSLTYPSGVALTETRDNGGRLTAIGGANDLYAVQSFKGAHQPGLIQLGGGLILESNEYDARRRLLARRYQSGGRLLAEVRYRYDRADNREARQEVHRHGRADLFSYDADNRLSRADFGARPAIPGAVRIGASQLASQFGLELGFFARTYGYENTRDLLLGSTLLNPDAAILPLPPPFAGSLGGHDSMNFAREVDGVTLAAPDGLGNPTQMRLWVRRPGVADPVPVLATLTFNAFSHLVRVAYSDQGVPVVVDYRHRPDGSLHYRKVTRNGVVVSERALVYHDGLLLEEFEASGGPTPVARYYYADEDSPFAADLADAAGQLQRYYYLRDAQGSVMAVANDAGEVVERVSYDAWGQPVLQGRDTAPPRLARVLQGANNELLLQFTETVMPPLTGAGGNVELVTDTAPLADAFELVGPSGAIPADATYQENLAGFPFGTVIRLAPQGTVPGSFTLTVRSGRLVDEWGLPNPAETINLTLAAPGTVLHTGPAPGSTAPARLGRSAIGSPFLFHGQYFDFDTGLLYLRARFYDPFTGSFLRQDPIEYQDSVNLYAGFAHNPTSRRDPTGLGIKLKKATGGTGGGPSGTVTRGGGRPPRGPDDTIPDGAPLDTTVPDTQVKRSTLANSSVDTVTSPGPANSTHQPAPAPPPPKPRTEFVQRGLAFTPEQAADFEIQQFMRGTILSKTARDGIPDHVARQALLADINQRIARGEGLEGFTAGQLAWMSDDMKLAVAHLGGTEFGISTGKRGRAQIQPDGSRDHTRPGTVEWAVTHAKARTREEKVQHDPYLLVLEVNQNAGVRGHNAEEADEVTFFGRIEPISAKLYRINVDNNGNITFTLMNEFRR